jgi:hypothetical protein
MNTPQGVGFNIALTPKYSLLDKRTPDEVYFQGLEQLKLAA